MKVILQKDLKDVGKAGEVISVKEGFARNFLFPKRLALKFSKSSLKEKAHYDNIINRKKEKANLLRDEVLKKLEEQSLSFKMSVNEEGNIFGSVTAAMISSELNKKEFEVGKRDILLKEPLKTLGEHEVEVQLSSDKKTKVKVLLEQV